MAEVVLSVAVETIFQKLGSFAFQEIGLMWGVNSQLEKLKNTLSTIKAVLLDAEEQQANNHEVRDWLEKLKDAVYDADDVLDEFQTEDLRRQVEIHGSMKKKVRDLFSRSNPLAFRRRMGDKLKKIREALEEIAANRKNFHLTERVNTRTDNRVRETHSFIHTLDVIGREDDKKEIIKLLIGSSDRENVSIVPIVGIGGLGKTTLAQLVYNDERVVSHFDPRMWVCVTEDFDIKKLIGKIIKSATNDDFGNLDMDQLQICLRNTLNGMKFLLILDDVWNENNDEWVKLKILLSGGAKGSKIIVTTRSEKVASIMGTVEAYHLELLQDDDCWSLFKKCAFKEGEENKYPKLIQIGKEIVKKSSGVPLAVKTLGGMLFLNTVECDWLFVENNDLWKLPQKEDGILAILRLSYDNMPQYLKQCFAYCSIFPQDYEIERYQLISLWIAQGIIQSLDGSRELEDIGNQYINELLSRSFFHDVDEDFDTEILSFKMHDLVHDLARSVAGSEWLIADFNTNVNMISNRVRHLLFSEIDLSGKEFPRSVLKVKKMRSFNFLFNVGPITKPFIDTLIVNFKCLRVLDFNGTEFEELPSSIGDLKHLRYFTLDGNARIKALPNSICKLVNLQMLHLCGCEQLQELPKHIGKLINLRNLDLTSQQVCLPEKGLQGLTSLRSLWLYRCDCMTSIPEGMRHLTALRELRIQECPKIAYLPSSIKYLTALEKLWIMDCEELNLLEGEGMEGLRSLRSLSIWGLPKLVALPQGLQQSAAISLQYLYFRNCSNLTTLPECLKDLTSLLRLYIVDCSNLLSLPEGMHCLTALRLLHIEGCPHLSRRCEKEIGEDWPKISHIPERFIEDASEDNGSD